MQIHEFIFCKIKNNMLARLSLQSIIQQFLQCFVAKFVNLQKSDAI